MYVKVLVTAGAKKEETEKIAEDEYQISVREPAERNLANRRVIKIIRGLLKIKGEVKIIAGHHSPKKIVSIEK